MPQDQLEKQADLNAMIPLMDIRLLAYDQLRRTFLSEPQKSSFSLWARSLTDFPLSEEHTSIKEGVRLIADFLVTYDEAGNSGYEDLRWDYTRLFVGPYKIPAPPWESVYRNKDRLLFQAETLEVRHAYFKYCFMPRKFGHEADDHLGLELDFMYQLTLMARKEIEKGASEALREILKDQKAFLQEHLLRWVPEFSRQVLKNCQTDFYRGMAMILAGYLALDLTALDELLNRLD